MGGRQATPLAASPPMIDSLLGLSLLALLHAPQGPAPAPASAQAAPEVRWEDVELPAHFVLDLESAVVASRAPEGRPLLSYEGGRLSSAVPLRALPREEGPGTRGVVSRDLGDLVPGVEAEVGTELIFDLFGETWGYLRVTALDEQSVTLEYALEPRSARRQLVRDPAELSASSSDRGVELTWTASDAGTYRIERRRLARGDERAPTDWILLGEAATGSWFDEEVSSSQVAEYRVSLAHEGFGSRALGVGGFAPAGELLRVGPNQSLNLLSGRVDDERSDLEVEFVRPTGVQLKPGAGVQARVLSAAEFSAWEVPMPMATGNLSQRYYVGVERSLVLRLAEGALARVRVVAIEDSEVLLERQINLDGSRTFPPTPELRSASWERGRGAVFELDPGPARPAEERSGFLIEREHPEGDWSECVRGEPGVLELVDPLETQELLVRYRSRRWLEGGALSAATEPVSVLFGDDGAEGSDALLSRALADLGASEFSRRTRAREVLVALGDRAWPALREALRSDNPELAEAARELLMLESAPETADGGPGGHGLSGLLLGVRAEELGAGAPPARDWIASSPEVRASAALRGSGWREDTPEHVALWRRVLSDSDPEESVRLAAALAAGLQRQGLGPDLRQQPRGLARAGLAPLGGALPPRPSLAQTDARSSAWASLAMLQAWHDLGLSASLGSEEYDLASERYELARALVAQLSRSGDDHFLESALRITSNPAAELRAALDLLELRSEAEPEEEPRVVELDTLDLAPLAVELELLKLDPERELVVVLPEGEYAPLPDGRPLVADGGRFRLRAAGRVLLRSGFTLMNGCSATLSGVELDVTGGVALNLVKSDARLEGCRLRTTGAGIMGLDSTLELIDTSVVAGTDPTSEAVGVRFSGRSLLLARDSRVESTGQAVFGARAALFDACVITSSARNAVEGTGEGDLWAVRSLFSAPNLAIGRVTGGVLDGVALFGGVQKSLKASSGLRLCAEHLWHNEDLAGLTTEQWLERCALHR